MKKETIVDGAILRRGSRYRLVTELWSSKTNPKMKAARGEARRVGIFPANGERIRVQYVPVDAKGTPLKYNDRGQAQDWRWADLDTMAAWAKAVL